MSIGAPVAADVPDLFDVIIDGKGYIFLRTIDTSLPFRTQRALFARTQTFVERSNVSSLYGDSDQDFFQTESQKDFTGGEGQFFFKADDTESTSKYYTGSGINTDFPGQAFNQQTSASVTTVASIKASCGRGKQAFEGHAYSSNTNLYTVSNAATVTDQGAHGAGNVNQWGMCSDGPNVYIAGATTIRRWDGAAFNNFGAANANAGSLAFLNNALYSCDGSTLKVYDTAGVATTLFTWRDARGTALTAFDQHPKLVPFGGQLLIFWPYLIDSPELWLYDGSATKRVAKLDPSMVGFDCFVFDGITFMSGNIFDTIPGQNGTIGTIPVVMYWSNGNMGEHWRSHTGISGGSRTVFNDASMPTLGACNGELLIASPQDTAIVAWHPGTGAFSKVATIQALPAFGGANPATMSSSATSIFIAWDKTAAVAGTFYPSTTPISAASLTTSIFDFGNSLTKIFRSVKVDFLKSSSSNCSVDIYYGVDTNSPGTALQSGAVSGTSYTLPANTSGRGISIKVVLNDGTINDGFGTPIPGTHSVPTVKRIYVRAAPVLQSFRKCEYILDCSGVDGKSPVILNNNETPHPLDGLQMATNLDSFIGGTSSVTIVDSFSSFSGMASPGDCEIIEVAPEEFIARIWVREV